MGVMVRTSRIVAAGADGGVWAQAMADRSRSGKGRSRMDQAIAGRTPLSNAEGPKADSDTISGWKGTVLVRKIPT